MAVSDRIAEIFGFPASMGGGTGLQLGGGQGLSLGGLNAVPGMGGGTGLSPSVGMASMTMPQAPSFNPMMLMQGLALLQQPQQQAVPMPGPQVGQFHRGQQIPLQQLIQMYRGGGLLK